MDEKQKKILLIGGALLIGAFLLSNRQTGGGGGVGTVTDIITGFTVSQDEPVAPIGGGDTTYNITYPDPPSIILPSPNFIPSYITPTPQISETKKIQTIKEIITGVSPSPPQITEPSKKKEAAKEIVSRPPSTGIEILDKIGWGGFS